MTLNKYNIYLDSLGCVKNLVDSELALGLLYRAGFVLTEDPEEADVIIVNTCGFINDAKEESINRIIQLADLKEERCKLMVVCGCLSQRYKDELLAEMPEIDLMLGTNDYDTIAAEITAALGENVVCGQFDMEESLRERVRLTPGYTAYIKIAEGCNNNCAFCAIPGIRGGLKSRAVDDIVAEAAVLREEGVEELILIAQDTTAYGMDIYGKPSLGRLIEAVAPLGFHWVRALYSYPDRIDDELLAAMAKHKNVCHYLDIPLQHISGPVLKAMGRTYDRNFVEELFAKIKKYLPDCVIRTTFMVGFPGETEEQFDDLLDFASAAELPWAGVFMYSPEEDTPAAAMPCQVDDRLKARRYNKLQAALGLASKEHKADWIGRTLEVLVEKPSEHLAGYYEGRSRYHAPDVDGVVYIENSAGSLTPDSVGSFVNVKIHTAETYDVIGSLTE
ncbi:MAG: 30S ribosomal protein S12 methylthiotransferase RimO [Bacillota bacterium]|jgi:ribosomal protein S12 methylthiotransferase